MSEWLWTWGGTSFGFRSGDDLFTVHGKHVGRFHGNEVYSTDGHYLGELGDADRLLVRHSRVGKTKPPILPKVRMGRMDHMGRMGRMLRMGCEDFPSPDEF